MIDKIIKLKVEELTPYVGNAKQHPQSQIDAIKKSIEKFGFNDPIAVWGKDNIIVEGHGRLAAAEQLGIDEVPCIRLDHMSEEERRAYTIAHNSTSLNSGFDLEKLNAELADIDFDILGLGLDEQIKDIEKQFAKEIIEDDFDAELPEEPKAKLGDIYQLGNHRLMCGDSVSITDIEKLLNGKKIDVLYTDPPYGMDLDTDFSGMKNNLDFAKEKNFTGGKKYDAGIVDAFNPEMINTIFALNIKEVFLWGADYFAELLPNKNDGSWIVWDKRANGNDNLEEDYSSDKMYGSCFELCWSKNKHKRDIARIKWASVFGTEQEFDHKRHHPTQKPIKLSSWFLNRYSNENDNILDLFGGSGSTLIACEQLNRNCYMMELDTKYCDVIIKRWENLTGAKAVKITQ